MARQQRQPRRCVDCYDAWVTPPARWCEDCRARTGRNPDRGVSLMQPDTWDDDTDNNDEEEDGLLFFREHLAELRELRAQR